MCLFSSWTVSIVNSFGFSICNGFLHIHNFDLLIVEVYRVEHQIVCPYFPFIYMVLNLEGKIVNDLDGLFNHNMIDSHQLSRGAAIVTFGGLNL